jgi:hypothetical protein
MAMKPRSGITLHIISTAAMCQGVIVTKTEKQAEQLRLIANEYCKNIGLKPPVIRTYNHKPTPDDMLKVHLIVKDEHTVFEKE